MKSFIISLLFSTSVLAQGLPEHGDLIMDMDNFHNDKSDALIALFASVDGFPDKPEKAIKTMKVKIHNRKLKTTFKNIAYGSYAISVLHDENANGKMDTNWLGIPQEGYAVSNDATVFFEPPEFDDARFVLESRVSPMHMTLQY